MAEVVLFNPKIGIYSRVFRPFIPLGLLSVSSLLDQAGVRVRIIDQHMDRNWRRTLTGELKTRPRLVGITSMTGSQLRGAIDASRLVRDHGNTPIVWGGVHASLFPDQTLDNPFVDFVVRGEGERALFQLYDTLTRGGDLDRVPNLSYIRSRAVHHSPTGDFLDLDELPDVPYHLLDVKAYLHTYFYKRDVIEIETSRGCPHACGFCYNKAFNRQVWRPRTPAAILRAIKRLMARNGLRSILVIDDSFFVNIDRVNEFIRMVLAEHLDINLGFQGRLDGITRMNDARLEDLVRAGTRFLQFGVESGSPRILKLINKQVTIEEVLEVNRRLSRFKELYSFYNFMVGLPTETEEDIMRTVDLAWRLLKENPNANIGTIHIYKEYPGTPLYDQAVATGYQAPRTLEEWSEYDWQSAVGRDRDATQMKLIKGITVASYCLDDKIRMLGDSQLASILSDLYRPISRFRFRHKFFRFMPETVLFS
ncbi:B12-binding domain-containing radical SAM protein [bacterium]|nr:B12-binding domain-containing radical SAM protein [candidate division CSSED10-310 bacterium]